MQEFKPYDRKPQTVEAVQLSRANQGIVKRWAKATEIPLGSRHAEDTETVLQVRVLTGEVVSVYSGDWLVKTQEGIEVFSDWAFRRTYELATATV